MTAYWSEAAGNGKRAAILAGYAPGSAKVTASRLLTKANLVAELKARTDRRNQVAIANADRRDRVLSAIILDEGQGTSERIAAIKEMNKIEGRHFLKRQVVGGLTLEQVIEESRS